MKKLALILLLFCGYSSQADINRHAGYIHGIADATSLFCKWRGKMPKSTFDSSILLMKRDIDREYDFILEGYYQ